MFCSPSFSFTAIKSCHLQSFYSFFSSISLIKSCQLWLFLFFCLPHHCYLILPPSVFCSPCPSLTLINLAIYRDCMLHIPNDCHFTYALLCLTLSLWHDLAAVCYHLKKRITSRNYSAFILHVFIMAISCLISTASSSRCLCLFKHHASSLWQLASGVCPAAPNACTCSFTGTCHTTYNRLIQVIHWLWKHN